MEPSNARYWLFEPGKPTRGPYTLIQIQGLEKNTVLSPKTHLCLVGETAWKPMKLILGGSPPCPLKVQAQPVVEPVKTPEAGEPASPAPPPLPDLNTHETPPPLPGSLNNQDLIWKWGPIGAVAILLLLGISISSIDKSSRPHAVSGLEEIKKKELQTRQELELKLLGHRKLWWEVKSEVLEKTLKVLASSESAKALGNADQDGPSMAEEKTRKYLVERRGQALLKKAKSLLEDLPDSALQEFREKTQDDARMENTFLDWMTLEGLRDFGYLTRIWQEQGKEPLHSSEEAAVFLKNSGKPSLDKPIQVERLRGKPGLRIQFGALSFAEEVEISLPTGIVAGPFFRLCKLLGRKGSDADTLTCQVENSRFQADFWPGLQAYLEKGQARPWAYSLFRDSHQQACLALATGQAAEIPDKYAVSGKEKLPLKDLFAKLSPSVPLIINHGSGSGSGILVEFSGRMFVITNRHVVAGMGNRGLTVRFLKGTEPGKETHWDVGPSLAKVVHHHRTADLALIDINGARKMLEEQEIKPVVISPRKYTPAVGEEVFAIGHPGGGKEILTRTLTHGIVSAVGRKMENSNYLQVTVPLNPGNSGGPLFDYFGRVVGVNTMIIRKSQDRGGIALEALNFALGIPYVHEILDAAKTSPSNEETEPGKADIAQATGKMMQGVSFLAKQGYKPLNGTLDSSTKTYQIPPGGKAQMEFDSGGAIRLAIAGGCAGAKDIDFLVIHSENNKYLAIEEEVSDQPNLLFTNPDKGLLTVILYNPTETAAAVAISLHKK
ncbi:MAG: serine protease [Gemmataceae bacterium]|nr:serine protease [Gemmataceae bacterium]